MSNTRPQPLVSEGPRVACPRCDVPLDGGPVLYWCSRCGHGTYAADLHPERARQQSSGRRRSELAQTGPGRWHQAEDRSDPPARRILMSLRIARYVIAACDRCGPGWWAKDPACGAVTPHFLSELCAREQLAADYGWVIRHRLFREPVMTCRSCSRQAPAPQDCWFDRLEQRLARVLGADEPADGGTAETAACRRPPPSHPETDGAVLTVEQEELLAELDASLFPDDPSAWP